MTEADWLAATDPAPMLEFIRGAADDRRLRLFGCACCRRVWHRLPDPRSRRAVEVAERFADGAATSDELAAAHRAAHGAAHDADAGRRQDDGERAAAAVTHPDPTHQRGGFCVPADGAACHAVWAAGWHARLTGAGGRERKRNWRRGVREEQAAQAALVRDIFRPFRPVAVEPRWLTPTVAGVAVAIYADRAFHRMPILADCLADAGCDDDHLLSHFRADELHARGCVVLDRILGTP